MAEDELEHLSEFQCPVCRKQYIIRSSYVRHSRKCLERTLTSSRQKSCRQCANSKVRCDKSRPACARCTIRGNRCGYVESPASSSQRRRTQYRTLRSPSRRGVRSSSPENSLSTSQTRYIPVLGNELLTDGSVSSDCGDYQTISQWDASSGLKTGSRPSLADVSPQLQSITVSTAGAYISPNHTDHPTVDTGSYALLGNTETHTDSSEILPTRCLSFISRILRTYPRMMAGREQLPPFIHEAQISNGSISTPLANCLALSRMWESGNRGDSGKEIVESSIRREMEKLFNEYHDYDDSTLVAAFQSALIYAIILLFPKPQQPPSEMFDLQTLTSLREFGLYVTQSKLLLPEERSHTRPSWENWVLVCCKRKTFFCVNLFCWINAMYNGFTAFPCADVDFMPAPAGKVLWNATSREKWEVAYDRWLGRWAGLSIYSVGDLQRVYRGPDLDLRSEMWLEEADEFGIMCIALLHNTKPQVSNRVEGE